MIQNEREYAATKKKLGMLAKSLAEAEKHSNLELPDGVRQAGLNGIRFLMEDLEAEVAEYERLRRGRVSSLSLPSVLDELPSLLARARIARGWTHRDLAKALGTTEQQVQKDERGGYERASLSRLRRVAQILGVRIGGRAKLAARRERATGDPPASRS